MYSYHTRLLTALSLVVTALGQDPSNGPSFLPPPPLLVSTTTWNETIIFTCPPAPTILVNVTQYIPITETTTDTEITTTSILDTTTSPITIYQTVISTTVLTSTRIVTETSTTVTPTTATATETVVVALPTTETETETSTIVSPTTATETSVAIIPTTATETSITISPVTATATEELLLSTLTQRVTSVQLCPTRVVNPSYTAQGPYPTDWTWGCPPGWLCRPTRENCNFEAGIPDQGFLCPPNHCIPAEALPVPLATWDDTIFGNSTPAQNPALTIQAIDDYFNMNPSDFGLSYEIFVIEETITLTSTTVRPPSPTVGARQAQISVPGACFPWCNNCLLEAQANGKTPALCVPGSAFETSLEKCEQCIQVHKTDDSGGFVQIAPQFQQFLDYCDQFSTVIVTTSVTTTTTNSVGSTLSSASSFISTAVTPRSSSVTLSPTRPQISITTVTAPIITTVVSTRYSESTVAGDDWSQATIILPLENNSTTTIYGSDLTNGATLVLPVAQTTNSYTTTLTGGTAPAISAPATTISGTMVTGALSSAVASGSALPSQFSGGALRFGDVRDSRCWWTLVPGMVLLLVLAIGL